MPYEAIAADYIIVNPNNILKDSVLLAENGYVIKHLPISVFIKKYPSLTCTHQKNSILSAGFINAHTHLELSFLGKHRGNKTFFNWVKSNSMEIENTPYEEKIKKNKLALEQAIQVGTVGFADISNTGIMIDTLEKMNIPHHTFIELIGFQEKYSQTIWNNTICKQQHELKKKTVTLSAHSLYSLSKSLLSKLASQDTMQSIHIDELFSEREFFESGCGEIQQFMADINVWEENWIAPRKSPYDYFKSLGFSRKTRLVHNLYINEEELRNLKGYSFILCPRSNQFLHKTQANYALFERLQIPFALGTDSLASNHDLSILNEMKFLKQVTALSNKTIFSAGTENGARMLNFTDFGTLDIGKKAICNSFCYNVLSNNPLEQLLSEPIKKHTLFGI